MGDEAADASCEWSGGKGTMKFTRNVAAKAKARREIARQADTTFIWAYSTTNTAVKDQAPTKHEANAYFMYNVDSGAGGADNQTPALITLHAGLMLMSWGILLPWGASIAACCKKSGYQIGTEPAWFSLHKTLMPSGWLLQLAGFACILVYKSGRLVVQPAGQAHVVIGMIVVVLGTLNPFVALVRPHPVDHDGNRTFGRRVWELVHKYLIGWTAVVGGLVNCVVAAGMLLSGAYSYDRSIPVLVLTVLGVEAVFALVLCGRVLRTNGKAGTQSWKSTSELSATGALDVLIEEHEQQSGESS